MRAPEVLIQSFSIRPDDVIEITFSEQRDQQEAAGMVKTVVFERVFFMEEIDELEDDLRDLVDEVIRFIRQPDTRKLPSLSRDELDDDE